MQARRQKSVRSQWVTCDESRRTYARVHTHTHIQGYRLEVWNASVTAKKCTQSVDDVRQVQAHLRTRAHTHTHTHTQTYTHTTDVVRQVQAHTSHLAVCTHMYVLSRV